MHYAGVQGKLIIWYLDIKLTNRNYINKRRINNRPSKSVNTFLYENHLQAIVNYTSRIAAFLFSNFRPFKKF